MADDVVSLPSTTANADQAAADKVAATRRRKAEYIKRWRAVQTGQPPLDVPAACIDCDVQFIRNSGTQKRCVSCRRPRALLVKRKNEAARRRRRAIAAQCATCSARFFRVSSKHKYCGPCGKASRAKTCEAWRARSPDEVLATRKRTYIKRQLSPRHRLNGSISSGIGHSIRGKNRRRWGSLVGYTINDLMPHLERQFTKGMSWDNYGEWHVDHILPMASFAFDCAEDPEFRACWALTNLRPLWAADNLKKNARRTLLI